MNIDDLHKAVCASRDRIKGGVYCPEDEAIATLFTATGRLESSLSAALAGKEKVEGALCRASTALKLSEEALRAAIGTHGDKCYDEACPTIKICGDARMSIMAALSSSPCPHAAELARVRGIPDDGTFHHRLGVDGLFGVMSRMEICRLLREHIEGRPPVDRTAEETPKEGFDYDEPFPCACCGKNSTNYLCGKCCKDRCAGA